MSRARSLGTLAILFTTATLWGVSTPSAQAQQDGPSYDVAKKAFGKLLAKKSDDQSVQKKVTAKIGGKDVGVVVGKLEAAAPGPEAIVPGFCDDQPIHFMVKVWAELANPDGTGTGQYVNPEKYRWNPKQHMYLHFQSERPIQVGLFQNYPGLGQTRPTKPITPIPSIPSSYATLLPGQDVRLDVLLRTDDDLEKEFISVVLVVAGAPIGGDTLPINRPREPGVGFTPADLSTTTTTLQNVSNGSNAVASNAGRDSTVVINETKINNQGLVLVTKMDAVGPSMAQPSPNYEDVAIIMVCNGVLGANQLTLHK